MTALSIRKRILEIKGIDSYTDLASAIKVKTGKHIHPTTIQKIATGERRPSLDTIETVAEFAEIPMKMFFEEEINRESNTEILTINKESVYICGHDLTVKEYQNQRVMTLEDIDILHERPMGTAQRNFKYNRKRFLKGIDYYFIRGDEFRPLGIDSNFGGYLLTESGYLMLVKSFRDERAWEVQRHLVNAYFRGRMNEVYLQQLTLMQNMITDLQNRITTLEQQNKAHQKLLSYNPALDTETNDLINDLALYLKHYRITNKLDYRRMGKLLGVSGTHVWRLENKKNIRSITNNMFHRVVVATGYSPGEWVSQIN